MGGSALTGIRKILASGIFRAPNWDALCSQYGDECSLPEIGKVNPQPEMYASMERHGALQCFGAFADDTLVGFAAVLIYIDPQYGKKVAIVENVFIAPSFRRTTLGLGLLIKVERHAKENGCTAIGYSVPIGGSLERLLARRKKFRKTTSVFTRNLE
jgi:GNAT superfamily N-acetyltransferase